MNWLLRALFPRSERLCSAGADGEKGTYFSWSRVLKHLNVDINRVHVVNISMKDSLKTSLNSQLVIFECE